MNLMLIIGRYCKIAPDGTREDVPSQERAAEVGKEKQDTSGERTPSLDHSETPENRSSDPSTPEHTDPSSSNIISLTPLAFIPAESLKHQQQEGVVPTASVE